MCKLPGSTRPARDMLALHLKERGLGTEAEVVAQGPSGQAQPQPMASPKGAWVQGCAEEQAGAPAELHGAWCMGCFAKWRPGWQIPREEGADDGANNRCFWNAERQATSTLSALHLGGQVHLLPFHGHRHRLLEAMFCRVIQERQDATRRVLPTVGLGREPGHLSCPSAAQSTVGQ